jgi:hypothetical protein
MDQPAAVEHATVLRKGQVAGKQCRRHLRGFQAGAVDGITQVLNLSDRDVGPVF